MTFPGKRFIWIKQCLCLGGIYFDRRSDLRVFSSGNFNAHTYRNDILDVYVCPYAGAIDDAFVLQDNNARPLRLHIVDACLEQETIQRMQ
ncbi:hypothetical protein TNCV_1217741 [Trichonephila clavipes]|nr:hypothetical protein TNCV_1217741 [Trichonephila clavipes]